MKAQEFDALMRATIEEPAAHRLSDLLQQGLIKPADINRFKVSSIEFRRAILANYESLDPVVRDELRASLLRDYQRTVDDLVADIAQRDPALVEPEAATDPPAGAFTEKRNRDRRDLYQVVIDRVKAKALGWWSARIR